MMKAYEDHNHIREAAVDAFCDVHRTDRPWCWYYEPSKEGCWSDWMFHDEDLEAESAYWSEVALWGVGVGNDETGAE